MTNKELEEMHKEFLNRIEFAHIYRGFYKHLNIYYQYYYYNYIYSYENDYFYYNNHILANAHSIFESLPHLDYVIELTASQMPMDYIIETIKGKENLIPNINQEDRFDEEHNTNFERITKMELLGCFAKVDQSLIDELERNGFEEYKYLYNGDYKIIKIGDLKDKNVVFMCPDNIKIAYKNLLSLSDEELIRLIDNDNYEEGTLKKCIKDLLRTEDDLYKFVFYHECGHCAFYEINNKTSKNNTIIFEKQANYYASIVLDGEYDLLIEIINNRIGKQYKNPLLKSHEYTKGIIKFKEEEHELYE